MTKDIESKTLKIEWLGECPKCTRKTVEVFTIKGSKELLFDGDKVKCWCGQTGEIETNNGDAWVEWDEVVISDKDKHDTYYRSKYPDFWERLPACNHQACEHYEVSLNAWLVALKREKAKLEGCVVVPVEPTRDELISIASVCLEPRNKGENFDFLSINEAKAVRAAMVEAARGGNDGKE